MRERIESELQSAPRSRQRRQEQGGAVRHPEQKQDDSHRQPTQASPPAPGRKVWHTPHRQFGPPGPFRRNRSRHLPYPERVQQVSGARFRERKPLRVHSPQRYKRFYETRWFDFWTLCSTQRQASPFVKGSGGRCRIREKAGTGKLRRSEQTAEFGEGEVVGHLAPVGDRTELPPDGHKVRNRLRIALR